MLSRAMSGIVAKDSTRRCAARVGEQDRRERDDRDTRSTESARRASPDPYRAAAAQAHRRRAARRCRSSPASRRSRAACDPRDRALSCRRPARAALAAAAGLPFTTANASGVHHALVHSSGPGSRSSAPTYRLVEHRRAAIEDLSHAIDEIERDRVEEVDRPAQYEIAKLRMTAHSSPNRPAYRGTSCRAP